MIERNYLRFAFEEKTFPIFKCPTCSVGSLTYAKDLEPYEPKYSKEWRQESGYWEDLRLFLTVELICSNLNFGERVVAACKGGIEPDFGQDDGSYSRYFHIQTIFPAPHVIEIPSGLPISVRTELERSFEVFWRNKMLATHCIRSALEALLSHLGIPDEIDGKWVSFGNRIHTYAEMNSQHSDFFNVLRPIINESSHHGSPTEIDVLLDIYEALEIFLFDIFDDRSKRFEALKEKLRKHQKS